MMTHVARRIPDKNRSGFSSVSTRKGEKKKGKAKLKGIRSWDLNVARGV